MEGNTADVTVIPVSVILQTALLKPERSVRGRRRRGARSQRQ